MIILKRLIIGNFLSIANAELELNDQGLVLIEGINADDASAASNGSGKSSIVDAISWCLYGMTARGTTGDSVINLKAGKNCFVEIELEVDGDTYTIMRGRKHGVLKNRVMIRRGTADLTLGTDKQTQARINHLLGCGPDVFNASIYMGQESMPDLPAMTDKALKDVLEQALGLDRLDTAMDIATDRLGTAMTDYTTVQVQCERAESSVKTNTDKISHLGHTIELFEEHEKSLFRDLEVHQGQYKEDYEELVGKRNKCEALYEKAVKAKRIDLKPITEESESVIAPLKRAIKDKFEAAKDIEVNLKVLKRTAKELSATTGSCPTCLRPHEAVVDHTEELAINAAKQATCEAELDAIGDEIQVLRDQIDDAADKFAAQFDAAAKANYELPDLVVTQHNLDSANRALDTLCKRHAEFIKTNQERRDAKCARIKNATCELKAAESDLAYHEELVIKYGLQKVMLSDRIETLRRVKLALGRKGFRGEVLDQVTPYLNDRTAKYLQQLTDGNIEATWGTITQNSDGDYTENFHIAVQHTSGVDRFNNLSGGEKRKVRLACALALQDLIATRAVKPIKIFIADEIDDAIDETGLELLMGVLEAKAAEMGSVFIISHNDIGDWVRNKITVIKQDGVSTFKQP